MNHEIPQITTTALRKAQFNRDHSDSTVPSLFSQLIEWPPHAKQHVFPTVNRREEQKAFN